MEKRFWIGTSWKMNKTLSEAKAYASVLRQSAVWGTVGLRGFVVPPFTALAAVARELEGSPILVGAQTMHWADHGPYTGEISPRMVVDCGARIVELGHSERRGSFGETDRDVNRKVKAALGHGLRPLVCVGETAEENRVGAGPETVSRQVKMAFHGVDARLFSRALIAYEPVWAIGEQGRPASADYANAMHGTIRAVLAGLSPEGASVPILYGGSVAEGNSAALALQPEVDGLFVGRAAWEAEGFLRIVESVVAVVAAEAPV